MISKEPNIKIPVDLTNPGQFFACCGLLELADQIWPGAEGWFEPSQFCMKVDTCRREDLPRAKRIDGSIANGGPDRSPNFLVELLTEVKALKFDVGDDEESDDVDEAKEGSGPIEPIEPIELQWNDGQSAIYLNWWSEKSIKPWAGRMDVRVILRAMLDWINPLNPDPSNDLKVAYYKSPGKKTGKKREPFYFDSRRGNKSHPLDCGFSPDTHQMEAECCPALEALCFIGLQRARPAPTGVANQSRYSVWTRGSDEDPGLPISLVGPVTCGMIPWPSLGTYVFENFFRTDQRKYKSFSQASLERTSNV